MKKQDILKLVIIGILLFSVLPPGTACIGIIGLGTGYNMEEHYGYVDYQNTADCNLSGAILIFIDGDIVAGKILDMPIRYVAGFRCSPIKTIEFSLRMVKGNHTIVAYALSQNITAQRSYEYTMEGWEGEATEEETELEEEEDWLKCGVKNEKRRLAVPLADS